LRRNRTATLTINGTGSGYTITYPDTGGTAIAAKTVQLPSGVTLPANTSVAFTAFRGLFSETDSTARTFTGSSASTTGQLKIDVDAMGRVSVCSPDGSFGGYTTC
jgi:hypothetical protein